MPIYLVFCGKNIETKINRATCGKKLYFEKTIQFYYKKNYCTMKMNLIPEYEDLKYPNYQCGVLRLMGSRLIESALIAYYQILLAQLYMNNA